MMNNALTLHVTQSIATRSSATAKPVVPSTVTVSWMDLLTWMGRLSFAHNVNTHIDLEESLNLRHTTTQNPNKLETLNHDLHNVLPLCCGIRENDLCYKEVLGVCIAIVPISWPITLNWYKEEWGYCCPQ